MHEATVSKSWRCWAAIHRWKHIGPFAYCTRPACTLVIWYTGKQYVDLDIVDTRMVDEYEVVQK